MDIKDPVEFFKHMSIHETKVPMESVIRIEGFTNNLSKIHIFGINSHRCLELTPDGQDLTLVKGATTPYSVIYARGAQENKFFTVKQGSNDIEVVDLELKKKVAEYKGYPEEPYRKS